MKEKVQEVEEVLLRGSKRFVYFFAIDNHKGKRKLTKQVNNQVAQFIQEVKSSAGSEHVWTLLVDSFKSLSRE